MRKHSDETPDWDAQRNKIIGLGETSIRKSYYPELQQRILELEKKNRELQDAYSQQTAVEEELRQQFEETIAKDRELRESEERFRNLIEASPVSIVLVREGRFVYCNRVFCHMTGYDGPEEVLGRPLLDFVAPEMKERVAGYVRARARGEPADLHYESIGLRRDGSRFPYEITTTVIKLPEGPTTMAFITDITDRKQSEEAILRSAERLCRAELVAQIGHWEFHMDTGTVLASEGACTIYGLSGTRWSIPEVQKIPLPEFRPMLDEALRALIAGEKPYDVGFRIRRPTDNAIISIRSIAEYDPAAKIVFGVIVDTTLQKQTEDAIRESEAKYRAMVETSPDLIWEIDIKGRFTYLSPNALEMLGYPPRDLIGKTFFSLVPREVIPYARDLLENHVKNGVGVVTFEVKALHGDGHLMDLEIRSVPMRDVAGQVWGFRGITRDITEQKRSGARIRESEEMFRSLVQESTDGITLISEEGTIIEWNDAQVRISGISREEALGADNADLLISLMIPEHRSPERISRFRAAIADALRTGTSPFFSKPLDAEIIRRDGQRRFIQQITFPIPTSRGYRVGSMVRDVTDWKASQHALAVSEERYRSLVNITDTGYVMLDNRGFVIDANEVYLRLTGRGALTEILGHPVTDWTAPYDLERNAKEVEHCFRTGMVHGLEIDYLQTDGTIKPIEINATVFHTGDRDVVLTLCRDISERKKINAALQQARSKLNLLNAVTFQDIQTSAFSLSAYQELIRTIIADPKSMSYLEKQEIFLKKIVDTLAFARNYQEMGMHPSRWQNVRQVFLYAISHLDFLKIKQNLQVNNLEVFADPLLEKALFNIMENVVKHGVHASEVTLRYEERPEGLTLIIEDNGVGISLAEKNMIFDRGYGKDTGLGLFLVREVLSITGMTIRETGIPGTGTRFEITIPSGTYRFSSGAMLPEKPV
jgi:PAS domain S-box-containing protein